MFYLHIVLLVYYIVLYVGGFLLRAFTLVKLYFLAFSDSKATLSILTPHLTIHPALMVLFFFTTSFKYYLCVCARARAQSTNPHHCWSHPPPLPLTPPKIQHHNSIYIYIYYLKNNNHHHHKPTSTSHPQPNHNSNNPATDPRGNEELEETEKRMRELGERGGLGRDGET